MGKRIYQLVVRFCTKKEDLYFNGESYLKSNLSDQLLISGREIVLIFSRTRQMSENEILFTPSSLLRYELQKALCFYLAVAREIPEVERIFIISDGGETDLDFQSFTQTWKNCRCRKNFKPEDLKVIFSGSKKAKPVYIALTYWLKNELTLFANDGFRSLWSAFNAIYDAGDDCKNRERERDKINCFKSNMEKKFYKSSLSCMRKMIGKDFWHKQGLYLYVSKYDENKFRNWQYKDTVVLDAMHRKLLGTHRDGEGTKNALKEIEYELRNCKENEFQRLCFLVFEYIYFLRNRMFHGAKEYPIFEFYKKDSDNEDFVLCELLSCFVADSIRAFQK